MIKRTSDTTRTQYYSTALTPLDTNTTISRTRQSRLEFKSHSFSLSRQLKPKKTQSLIGYEYFKNKIMNNLQKVDQGSNTCQKQRDIIVKSIQQNTQQIKNMNKQKTIIQEEIQSLTMIERELEQRLKEARNKNIRIRNYFEQGIDLSSVDAIRQYISTQSPSFYGNEINIQTMTYEQLLQLQQMIGPVNRGLTPLQRSQLPKFNYRQSQIAETCTICFNVVSADQEVIRFFCNHIFHFDCIDTWISKQKTCPVCKQDIIKQQ